MLNMYIRAVQSVNAVKTRLKNLGRDESGATMLEYTLLAGLISLAGIVGMTAAAPSITAIWGTINTQMAAAAK